MQAMHALSRFHTSVARASEEKELPEPLAGLRMARVSAVCANGAAQMQEGVKAWQTGSVWQLCFAYCSGRSSPGCTRFGRLTWTACLASKYRATGEHAPSFSLLCAVMIMISASDIQSHRPRAVLAMCQCSMSSPSPSPGQSGFASLSQQTLARSGRFGGSRAARRL